MEIRVAGQIEAIRLRASCAQHHPRYYLLAQSALFSHPLFAENHFLPPLSCADLLAYNFTFTSSMISPCVPLRGAIYLIGSVALY